MAKKESDIVEIEREYESYMEPQEIYNLLIDYFKAGDWSIAEKSYKHKVDKDGKNEIEFEWVIEKEFDDLTKGVISLEAKFKVSPVKGEVPAFQRYYGKLKLKLKGTLVWDYKEKFKKNIFEMLYKRIFYDSIYKTWKKRLLSTIDGIDKRLRDHFAMLQA